MKCKCWKTVDERLKESGMKLSDKLFMFQVTPDLGLNLTMGLPLERVDGKRLQRKDPKILQVSYCPICGTELKDKPEEKEKSQAAEPGSEPN